jgi:hypothetical protein
MTNKITRSNRARKTQPFAGIFPGIDRGMIASYKITMLPAPINSRWQQAAAATKPL